MNKLKESGKKCSRFQGLDKIDIADPENLRLLHRGCYCMTSYIDELMGEFVAELEEQAELILER